MRKSLTVIEHPDPPLYEGDMEADLQTVARNRLAEQITGGLSQTTKLPCPSWGTSAARCRIGSLLAQERGTTCSHCYATKGRYLFDTVQNKLEERYEGLMHPLWTPAMVFLIRYYCDRYFRWMDSGDLQGANHLKNIATIAHHTPDVRHWLPTREMETVRSVIRELKVLPENLVVRVSAHLINGAPPRGFQNTSTVTVRHPRRGSYQCPSPEQENSCGECRACWEGDVKDVSYLLH